MPFPHWLRTWQRRWSSAPRARRRRALPAPAGRGVRPWLECLEDRLLLSAPTTSTSITEFTIPTASSSPVGITTGPDGNLWFAQSASHQIGRMTTSGAVTEFTLPTVNAGLLGITAGPDGNLWFAEQAGNKVGRITTSGAITEFTLATPNAEPAIITAGPDGNLWFTEFGSGKIASITTSGAVTEFNLPTAGSRPNGITVGPDNALWFTESGSGKIGRITTGGVVTEYSLPNAGAFPDLITSGPDGNLWFTEASGNMIGRITTSGVITEFPLPTANAEPVGITAGPDGNLWFTEFQGNKIGDITTSGVINEFTVPTAGAGPILITLGPDNALWFSELNANQIGRALVPQAATLSVPPVLVTFSPNAQNATLTAAVTSPGGTVNEGQVTFTVVGVPGASGAGAVVGGQASITVTLPGGLAAGPYTVTAAYADTNGTNFLSGSGGGTLFVNPAATTTKVVSVTHFGMFNLMEKVTVRVLDAAGNAVDGGSVTIQDGILSQTVGLSGGQATATFSPANALELFWELFLPYDVIASFLGTATDLPSGSSPPFVVGPLL